MKVYPTLINPALPFQVDGRITVMLPKPFYTSITNFVQVLPYSGIRMNPDIIFGSPSGN
jgi:hypothetical protein